MLHKQTQDQAMEKLHVYAEWERGCCRGRGDGAAGTASLQMPNPQQDITGDVCQQTTDVA